MIAFSMTAQASTAPSKKMAPSKIKIAAATPTPNPVVLEIDGKIFIKDSFPSTCTQFFKGEKCAPDSFGRYHVESKLEGGVIYSKAVFSSPDGPQVIEQSWQKDGHVQKAIVENKALEKVMELEVKGGKVYYKVTEKDGKVKTSDDDAEENLVVPSTVMFYVQPHYAEIMEGKEVRLKVAVLDRRESFTFIMKKIREDKAINGETVLVMQMAPNSIIVKALVDPMYFYVYPKTGEMFAYEGKSALRKKEGDKYKELVVRAAYDYKVNSWANSAQSTAPAASCDPAQFMDKPGATKCEVKRE